MFVTNSIVYFVDYICEFLLADRVIVSSLPTFVSMRMQQLDLTPFGGRTTRLTITQQGGYSGMAKKPFTGGHSMAVKYTMGPHSLVDNNTPLFGLYIMGYYRNL